MASASGIYCWKHIESGKRYIGQSIDVFRRKTEHKKLLKKDAHGNEYLQRAWDKYGENKFEFCVIEFCPEEMLGWKEIEWIEIHQTFKKNFGYNITLGGEAPKLSKETRRKISEAHKGKKHSEETKQKLRDAWKKRPPVSVEVRKKMADAIRGKNHYLYGKHMSDEAKRKSSESHKAFHQRKKIDLVRLVTV
jgi:hypothetical protein